jgi:hypothetical protein
VTPDRNQVLSEFIDAWNAGQRPDVDDYLVRVAEADRSELAEQLVMFLTVAPTPEYSDEALAEIRADPIVAQALDAPAQRGGLLPSLLAALRQRFALSTPQLAGELVRELELPDHRADKTASYLERLERGELDASRVSRRVFDGLARLFGVPRDELEGASALGSWAMPAAAPAFRAEDDAAEAAAPHLDLLAKGLATPGGAERDEVDDLFLGGR